jgi:hypothetical protein
MKRIIERRGFGEVPEGDKYGFDVTIDTYSAETNDEVDEMENDALNELKKEFGIDLRRNNREWFHDDSGLVIAYSKYISDRKVQELIDSCLEADNNEFIYEYPRMIFRFMTEDDIWLTEDDLL